MIITTFNWKGQFFDIKTLSENAVLVQPRTVITLENIHQLAQSIQEKSINEIEDVVVSYENIVIYFTHLIKFENKIIDFFKNINLGTAIENEIQTHHIKVNFEKGLDWEIVEKMTQLSRNEVINLFKAKTYTVAMLGFIPGFVYLEGLNERLACARKAIPRKKIPKGSVGIGGKQAGIYGLSSPGGWQIIGQTAANTFDMNAFPPTLLKPLDKVIFY
jgi:KipI family sensor histidine kinase inhibitor